MVMFIQQRSGGGEEEAGRGERGEKASYKERHGVREGGKEGGGATKMS